MKKALLYSVVALAALPLVAGPAPTKEVKKAENTDATTEVVVEVVEGEVEAPAEAPAE